MSEQPTREKIEEALGSFLTTWEEKVLSWAARQYLASLDASAPSAPTLSGDAIAGDGSPKDGTREPRKLSDDDIAELDTAMFSSMEHLYDAEPVASPPVPQEGVSDGALAQALFDYPAYGHWIGAESHNEHLAAALAPLLEENARLKAWIDKLAGACERMVVAEARVKELEAALKEVRDRSTSWHWVKEREQRKDD